MGYFSLFGDGGPRVSYGWKGANTMTDFSVLGQTQTDMPWTLVGTTDYPGVIDLYLLDYMGAGNAAIDMGIGEAGSEVAIVNNLYVSNGTTTRVMYCFQIPITFSAGTKISVRGSWTGAAPGTMYAVAVTKSDQFKNIPKLSGCDTFGMTVSGADIRGNLLHCSSGTSWCAAVQYSAGVTKNYKAVTLALGGPATSTSRNSGLMSAAAVMLDTTVPSTTPNKVIIGPIPVSTFNGNAFAASPMLCYTGIPNGSALYMSAFNGSATASYDFNAALYCWY